MPYLNAIRRIHDAYQAGAEYAKLRAVRLGERACMLEALLAFKQAYSEGILIRFARDAVLDFKS